MNQSKINEYLAFAKIHGIRNITKLMRLHKRNGAEIAFIVQLHENAQDDDVSDEDLISSSSLSSSSSSSSSKPSKPSPLPSSYLGSAKVTKKVHFTLPLPATKNNQTTVDYDPFDNTAAAAAKVAAAVAKMEKDEEEEEEEEMEEEDSEDDSDDDSDDDSGDDSDDDSIHSSQDNASRELPASMKLRNSINSKQKANSSKSSSSSTSSTSTSSMSSNDKLKTLKGSVILPDVLLRVRLNPLGCFSCTVWANIPHFHVFIANCTEELSVFEL